MEKVEKYIIIKKKCVIFWKFLYNGKWFVVWLFCFRIIVCNCDFFVVFFVDLIIVSVFLCRCRFVDSKKVFMIEEEVRFFYYLGFI